MLGTGDEVEPAAGDTPPTRASTVSATTGLRIPLSYQTFPEWPIPPGMAHLSDDRPESQMQPSEAEEIVGLLRQMRVMAHVHPTGLQKSAIRVVLPGAEKRFGTRTSCWTRGTGAG